MNKKGHEISREQEDHIWEGLGGGKERENDVTIL